MARATNQKVRAAAVQEDWISNFLYHVYEPHFTYSLEHSLIVSRSVCLESIMPSLYVYDSGDKCTCADAHIKRSTDLAR